MLTALWANHSAFIVEHDMTKYTHLTDEEFMSALLTRDDLTEIEHELLDRLIRAVDALGG